MLFLLKVAIFETRSFLVLGLYRTLISFFSPIATFGKTSISSKTRIATALKLSKF